MMFAHRFGPRYLCCRSRLPRFMFNIGTINMYLIVPDCLHSLLLDRRCFVARELYVGIATVFDRVIFNLM